MVPNNSWIKQHHENLIDMLDIDYSLNNKKDMLIQIKRRHEEEEVCSGGDQ
jgi:hypothetical protein